MIFSSQATFLASSCIKHCRNRGMNVGLGEQKKKFVFGYKGRGMNGWSPCTSLG